MHDQSDRSDRSDPLGPRTEPEPEFAEDNLWAGGGLHTARPQVVAPGRPWASVPPDVLGHLNHRFPPQCPEETWMVMCEVPLGRVEELLFGIAGEARPALAVGDPAELFSDCGHGAVVVAARLHLKRPAEGVEWKCPGVHWLQGAQAAL